MSFIKTALKEKPSRLSGNLCSMFFACLFFFSSSAVSDWWLPNVGDTGPGPDGSWPTKAQACQVCLQASGGYNWSGSTAPFIATYLGCDFFRPAGATAGNYTSIDNNGCVIINWGPEFDESKNMSPSCNDGSVPLGNPINALTGYKHQMETDYQDRDFQFNRYYSWNHHTSSWRHSYSKSLEILDYSVFQYLKFHRPEGGVISFVWHSDSTQSGASFDPDIKERISEIRDAQDILTGWKISFSDGSEESYDLYGRLTTIKGQSNIVESISYDETNNIITVSNSFSSRELDIHYDPTNDNRVEKIQVPDGLEYTYTYNATGDLTAVIYPNNGGTRNYHYENNSFSNALTGITDERGIRFATWSYDSQGRAISSEHHGSTEKVTLDYTHIDDSADSRVTATNALGKQTTYHFTTIHGVRKVTQVEGHQSAHCAAANKAYTYDPSGFLASKTDWLGRLTSYTRNTKGQELTRTEATGSPEERLFTTEWHPTLNLPVKITSLNREFIYTYDAEGNLLSKHVVNLTSP